MIGLVMTMMVVVMVVMVMVRMMVTTDRDNEGERDNSMWQRPLPQLLACYETGDLIII